ncbi:uncharacterized protein LACBIDRAFT_328445 [Laccaria bicolor S238N-H82]|uniref:Predicted protein n=1 Tax=Laccaria bicolor (strain S238N-H82 / ATCC MYA-4686) TaxID=486041 RepID=B0DEU5_LACBS|nr:uncharacterized protein LACBIDRAFT_328443 [Laccaria bicolor S238N-H82]XP_001882579.1 uncharacterized protein LACBIDRAFT_328445 [Laccaria bicolor S238N-H82]EDR06730.1 predicted protein [Laccaria bicolor S238N-H82]EDR06732.1 predicted protein [Laccaria bicolor S238N-H82]|eukprot:XP_001882577.1 predicted protein [Laccaria bicolor S238N-H82]
MQAVKKAVLRLATLSILRNMTLVLVIHYFAHTFRIDLPPPMGSQPNGVFEEHRRLQVVLHTTMQVDWVEDLMDSAADASKEGRYDRFLSEGTMFFVVVVCGVLEVGVESGKAEREEEVEYTAAAHAGFFWWKLKGFFQSQSLRPVNLCLSKKPWLQVEDASLGFERAYLGHTDVNSWITGAEVPGDDGNESTIR